FHRIDDSGAGASTLGMATRGLSCTTGAGPDVAAVRSTLPGRLASARGCWETHSARASAIALRVIVRCAGVGSSAAAADGDAGAEAGAGAEGGDVARVNLSAASLSSRRYQH